MHPQDSIPVEEAAEAAFEAILATKGLDLLVLEKEGVVMATSYRNVIPNMTRSLSPYAVIENVVVDEAVRGRGLGKELISQTLDAAWSRAATKRC